MQEQDGDNEPAHHARRPMNAFLIFCKRHRSVVRDKYPNLENRSITKILGEWWANLDKEEKACYTGLAKQYKDAFFSANPDFKWYKLPAPPLRTLASRPREPAEKAPSPTSELYHDSELEKTNNNSTKVDFNKKPIHVFEEPKPLSMFTPGKLADEAQMGGLSRLLDAKIETTTPNPYYSPFPLKYDPISYEYRSHNIIKMPSREDNIRELQNALSETTRVFEEDFDENIQKSRIYRNVAPGDLFTHQHVIDQVVDKQYSHDEYGYPKNWSDDDKARSGRSCKGKRYQEFMAVGGLMVNKRQRREYRDRTPEDGYSATCSWDAAARSECSPLPDERPPPAAPPRASPPPDPADPTDLADHDPNTNKTFKAADFDLDAKIAALPSLSLEKFQQKKRENKRKKKTINLKPKILGSSHIINSVPDYDRREMAESWRETVIGSQKRKPRKVSITRFEINSLVSGGLTDARQVSPEIKLALEAPCTAVHSMERGQQPGEAARACSADLLALATLAEVAANTERIDQSASAGAPHHASTV